MDHNFIVSSFNVGNYSKAQCLCLFKKNCSTLEQFQNSVSKLLSYWRFKSCYFLEQDIFSKNPVKVQYLRNCPPGVAKYEFAETLRYCKFYVCPWCWNRKFCASVFKKIKSIRKEIPGANFFVYEKIDFFKKSFYVNSSKLVCDQADQTIALCKKLTRRNGVKGGAANTYLEPTIDGFNVVSKLIICLTKQTTVPEDFVFKTKSKSATKLSYAFGSYPFSFLKKASASKNFCRFLTNFPKKKKKFIKFGCFYKQ